MNWTPTTAGLISEDKQFLYDCNWHDDIPRE